jgi:putative peptide zinc metalloprotease protein
VTAATGPLSTRLTAPGTPLGSPGSPDFIDTPRLAEGIELLGQFRNSGDSQPPSLVRRADGQVIQMSRLLYLVASRIDGSRDAATIAQLVSDDLGRSLTADQVRYLLTAKLVPLGVVADEDAAHVLPKANPLLALRARGTLLPERAANAVGAFFRPLFRLPVVVAVVISVTGLDYWVFTTHGLAAGLQQILRDPVNLVVVAALSVASAAFHECGHAAGCRFSGARPGRIGVGIYLVWPSFFTNVTDSYRLTRGGRLRTDLGGLYFNLIFILALAGLYAASSANILLLVIALTHLEMLEQLLPFARFDGYFILSDLIGVPDLFARVTPILKSALTRGRRQDPRIAGMRRKARIAVTSWVICVIPLLTLTFGYLLLHLPAMDRALWRATSAQARLMATAVAGRHYATATVDAISVLLASLSGAGLIYVVTGFARRVGTIGLRWSAGRPARRLVAAVAGVACATSLALLWVAGGQFRGW